MSSEEPGRLAGLIVETVPFLDEMANPISTTTTKTTMPTTTIRFMKKYLRGKSEIRKPKSERNTKEETTNHTNYTKRRRNPIRVIRVIRGFVLLFLRLSCFALDL